MWNSDRVINYLNLKIMKGLKISFILIILFASSCSDVLTEKPLTFLSPDKLQTNEGAEALLKAAYGSLQHNSYYQSAFVAQILFKSDYVLSRGSKYPASMYNLDPVNTATVASVWQAMYSGINVANVAITSFPQLALDKNLLNRWIAEAKVLRALHYFNLVRCFGGVPLRLTPVDNLNNASIARSSETEVYKQILTDLREALNSNLLPESVPTSSKGRISKYAAKILLADVLLTTEQYADAAKEALEIINSSKFSLEPDMGKLFSPEDGATHSGEIWSVPFSRTLPLGNYFVNDMNAPLPGYSNIGWYVVIGVLKSPVLAGWDDRDKRKQLWLYSTDPATPEGKSLSAAVPMLFKKFIDKNNTGQLGHGNDWPLYRLEDALLIYAEAQCMADKSPNTQAYESINKVRRRGYGLNIQTPSPGVDLSSLSMNSFREAVWEERSHEFVIEGKRWFDLKRMGKTIAKQKITAAGKNEFWGEEDWYWPIPRQEIDNNDLISDVDQNPGY